MPGRTRARGERPTAWQGNIGSSGAAALTALGYGAASVLRIIGGDLRAGIVQGGLEALVGRVIRALLDVLQVGIEFFVPGEPTRCSCDAHAEAQCTFQSLSFLLIIRADLAGKCS